MATVPATPTGLSGWDATALRKVAWDNKLQVDLVRPSIFTSIKASYKMVADQLIINKPGVLLDVSNIGKQAMAQSVRLALKLPLQGAPFYGSDSPLGDEDETELYYSTLYYNDIRKAVKMYTYGYEFNDTEYLSLNEGYNTQLADYLYELFDLRCQQALLMTYDDAIAGTGVAQARQFNSNIWIPGYSAGLVTYDSTALTRTAGDVDSEGYYSEATYAGATSAAENIGDALLAASGVGTSPTSVLNSDTLAAMVDYVQDNHTVNPLMIDGLPTFIVKIPVKVKSYLMNPNNSSSLGTWFQNVAQYRSDERDLLPGEFGRAYDCLLLVTDMRCATLTVTGSDGSWALSPGYIYPGNWDQRNTSAWNNASGSENWVYDVVTVMGANALGRYLKAPVKSGLLEQTDYEKIKGVCSYTGDGIQLPYFDKGTPDDTTRIYRGSMAVLVGRAPVWGNA